MTDTTEHAGVRAGQIDVVRAKPRAMKRHRQVPEKQAPPSEAETVRFDPWNNLHDFVQTNSIRKQILQLQIDWAPAHTLHS